MGIRRSGRRGRGRLVLGAATVLVVGAASVAAVGLGGRHRPTPKVKIAAGSTQVRRCTLISSDSADGRLGFGPASTLPIKATGTITWLPPAGRVVTEGHQLVRVDDRPVILLYGRLPQYRELVPPVRVPSEPQPGSAASQDGTPATPAATAGPAGPPEPAATAGPAGPPEPAATAGPAGPPGPAASSPVQHGADVSQLEAALTRLGYGGFDSGDEYTDATAAAVEAWQRDLGEDPTGELNLGDVFYAPGPLRVVPAARVGEGMSAGAVKSTSRRRVVTASVPVTSSWARVDEAVTLTLANGHRVPAKIASVSGQGGEAEQGLEPATRVVIAATHQAELTRAASTGVTVTHVDAKRTGVLCVPVTALVVLADGEYGLQSADPARPGYVAVRTGLFAQGKVEVSGTGVSAGMRVQMPAAG